MTELLVVIGILIVLLGLLFPALAGVRSAGLMTKSMSRMRQIGTWMRLYSTDHREAIVPSQFNYGPHRYRGKVRSDPNPPTSSDVFDPTEAGCGQYCGTWSDILWTLYVNKPILDVGFQLNNYDYRHDSPDVVLHRLIADLDDPFRSAAPNTRNTMLEGAAAGGPTAGGGGTPGPKPFFDGAQESGLPGYFAANNYFRYEPLHPNAFYRVFKYTGEIKMPDQSMYLVDSFAGEVIAPTEEAFQTVDRSSTPPTPGTGEVDFRYNDSCLMLFLDGHLESVDKWDEICDLEGTDGRGVRVRSLRSRTPACQ